MKFKYKFFEGKFLPIIIFKLKGKTELVEARAYIDTGASYSLFHADMAEILGLKLEEGIKHEFIVGDGDILKVYLHKVKMSLAGKKFIVTVGFSKEIGVGFNILGRKDIFDKFKICFDERNKEIDFMPNDI